MSSRTVTPMICDASLFPSIATAFGRFRTSVDGVDAKNLRPILSKSNFENIFENVFKLFLDFERMNAVLDVLN
jgi:hypothetical protein